VKAATLAELSHSQKSFDADISTDSEIVNMDLDNIVGNTVSIEFCRVQNGSNQIEKERVSLGSSAIFSKQFFNNSTCRRFDRSAMLTNAMED